MNNKKPVLILTAGWVLLIIFVAALILFFLGRNFYCECGFIKFWHGVVISSENSQHLTDPYTFTHIIHGFGFYFLLRLVVGRLPKSKRLILAVLLESLWEIFENTDFIINRYREATISLDYYGDSVINSVGDIITAALAFLFAARFPVWITILAVILIETALIFLIKDSLFLNLLMLIYPIEAIKIWQGAG